MNMTKEAQLCLDYQPPHLKNYLPGVFMSTNLKQLSICSGKPYRISYEEPAD